MVCEGVDCFRYANEVTNVMTELLKGYDPGGNVTIRAMLTCQHVQTI